MAKMNKEQIVQVFGTSANDTGSCQVQVALLSDRIMHISAHLKQNPKDFTSQRGLVKLVGQRRTFLNYLKRNDAQAHSQLNSLLQEHGLSR